MNILGESLACQGRGMMYSFEGGACIFVQGSACICRQSDCNKVGRPLTHILGDSFSFAGKKGVVNLGAPRECCWGFNCCTCKQGRPSKFKDPETQIRRFDAFAGMKGVAKYGGA